MTLLGQKSVTATNALYDGLKGLLVTGDTLSSKEFP